MSTEKHTRGHWIGLRNRELRGRRSFREIQKSFFLFLEQTINFERVEEILNELGLTDIPDDQRPSF